MLAKSGFQSRQSSKREKTFRLGRATKIAMTPISGQFWWHRPAERRLA
jgi:hypothetical protein